MFLFIPGIVLMFTPYSGWGACFIFVAACGFVYECVDSLVNPQSH